MEWTGSCWIAISSFNLCLSVAHPQMLTASTKLNNDLPNLIQCIQMIQARSVFSAIFSSVASFVSPIYSSPCLSLQTRPWHPGPSYKDPLSVCSQLFHSFPIPSPEVLIQCYSIMFPEHFHHSTSQAESMSITLFQHRLRRMLAPSPFLYWLSKYRLQEVRSQRSDILTGIVHQLICCNLRRPPPPNAATL